MNRMSVAVDLVGKPRMTQRDRWAHRACVDRYYEVKDVLRLEAIRQGYKLGDHILLIVALPMPKSWSAKKKNNMLGRSHQVKPDIDNLIKTVLDCLSDTDQTVHTVTASKIWGYIGMLDLENVAC